VEFVLAGEQTIADERLEVATEEGRFLKRLSMLYKDLVSMASGVNQYDGDWADPKYANVTTFLADTEQELQPLRPKVSDVT
jgi:hypothetical protein